MDNGSVLLEFCCFSFVAVLLAYCCRYFHKKQSQSEREHQEDPLYSANMVTTINNGSAFGHLSHSTRQRLMSLENGPSLLNDQDFDAEMARILNTDGSFRNGNLRSLMNDTISHFGNESDRPPSRPPSPPPIDDDEDEDSSLFLNAIQNISSLRPAITGEVNFAPGTPLTVMPVPENRPIQFRSRVESDPPPSYAIFSPPMYDELV